MPRKEMDRRQMLRLSAGTVGAPLFAGAGAAALAAGAPPLDPGLPAGVGTEAKLEALPGKAPLIKLSYRPPNYEAPLCGLQGHDHAERSLSSCAIISPTFPRSTLRPGASRWAERAPTTAFEIGFEELKNELRARRIRRRLPMLGQSARPREPACGGRRMGRRRHGQCALERRAGSRTSSPRPASRTRRSKSPSTVPTGRCSTRRRTSSRACRSWKALDPDTIVAYEMNGQPLPHFNGFPARLVAPGWTATYWMKHLTRIEARTKPLDNFWMKAAYRVPARLFPSTQRFVSQESRGEHADHRDHGELADHLSAFAPR